MELQENQSQPLKFHRHHVSKDLASEQVSLLVHHQVICNQPSKTAVKRSKCHKFFNHLVGVNVMLYERSPRNNVIRSPWAIKKLNKRISIKSEYAKRLEEEAEILKKLQHPNIIGYRGRYQETVKLTSRNL